MHKPFNLDLVLETGEPDQDYDHDFYDQVVTQLEAEGFEARHREFDKYQGVYIAVRGVGKFWHQAEMGYTSYQYGTATCYPMVCDSLMRDGDEPAADCVILQAEDGTIDASQMVEFCINHDTRGVRYDRLARELIGSTDTSKGPDNA